MKSLAPAESRSTGVPANNRILHVITRLDRGGSADNTILTCLGLQERGWSVDLVYGRTDHPTPMIRELENNRGVSTRVLSSLIRSISPWHDLKAYRALRKILKTGRYDLVHTHSSKAGILARRAAAGLGCKVVHTPHGHAFHGYLSPAATRVALFLERTAASWCDRIIVLTDRGREEHLELGVGTREQFVTIPSGIDLEKFRTVKNRREAARRRFGFPTGATVIGTVARLVKIKGVHDLIAAMEEIFPRRLDLRLLLAGDGDLRPELEARVADGPLAGRTVFAGHLEDPADAYAALDLFLLPSLNEGQGRSVVEAMAAGIPVIASDVGGLPEVLDQGRAGILVPPGSPCALAAATEKLLSSRELANQLALEASRHILNYGDLAMIDAIERLYQDLLEKYVENSAQ